MAIVTDAGINDAPNPVKAAADGYAFGTLHSTDAGGDCYDSARRGDCEDDDDDGGEN